MINCTRPQVLRIRFDLEADFAWRVCVCVCVYVNILYIHTPHTRTDVYFAFDQFKCYGS